MKHLPPHLRRTQSVSQTVNNFFLYTCMQNPRLRTVYRKRKWPLLAPVRKIMALGCKIIALGWNVFYESVKCLTHVFDVCKRWANSGSHEFVKKNMVRYMRPHGRFAHCSCKKCSTYPQPWPIGLGRGFVLHFHTRSVPTARFSLLYRNILFHHCLHLQPKK